MRVELRDRTEKHVRIYFERTRDEDIRRLCPQKAKTVEEAVDDFRETMKPGARSFGQTVYADGEYVGDVWLYCIHEEDEPDAMLSFCLFEKRVWGRGIMTQAARMLLEESRTRFALKTVGAFTDSENRGSARVLEKNGFALMERFYDGGREAGYYEKRMEEI